MKTVTLNSVPDLGIDHPTAIVLIVLIATAVIAYCLRNQ